MLSWRGGGGGGGGGGEEELRTVKNCVENRKERLKVAHCAYVEQENAVRTNKCIKWDVKSRVMKNGLK